MIANPNLKSESEIRIRSFPPSSAVVVPSAAPNVGARQEVLGLAEPDGRGLGAEQEQEPQRYFRTERGKRVVQ